MKKTNYETTTYEMDNDFMMDIVSGDEVYFAYIYHSKYGIKEQMFGMYKDDISLKAFTEIAAHNFPTFIDTYTENYMN